MRPGLLKEAQDELLEASLYYEDRQHGLGADFHERVAETISAIGEDPLRFPLYEGKQLHRQYRRARVSRFPYVVVFQVRENETLIVAIAHTSREPGYWENRPEPSP
jgi:hypothetical protein